MKHISVAGLFISLLVAGLVNPVSSLAQSRKTTTTPRPAAPKVTVAPDRLYLSNGTVVRCFVVSVTPTDVRFQMSNAPGQPVRRIDRAELTGIDARQFNLTATPPPAPVPTIAESNGPLTSPRAMLLDSLRQRASLKGLRLKLYDINFETGSAVLTPRSRTYLDTVARVLNEFPALIMEIGGHTDNVGQPRLNQTLSENRAKSVREQLVTGGKIAAKRITFRGYGETQPTATNATDAGRLLNRRVEMQFVGLDQTLMNRIYLQNGKVIEAPLVYLDRTKRSVLYKTADDAPLLELPCADVIRVVTADNRTETIDCPPPVVVVPVATDRPVINRKSSQSRAFAPFRIMPFGTASYMLSDKNWTGLTDGYAHTFGFGGGLLLEWRPAAAFAVGLQGGYQRFSTQVDYKTAASEPPIRQYLSEATQIPVLLSLRLYVGGLYLMPEGGLALLSVKGGFDGVSDSYSGMQTGFGGTVGYTANRDGRVSFDLGAFYRSYSAKTWDKQYGVPAMSYAGVRVGIGFSAGK